MSQTLTEVQAEVTRQLNRDYGCCATVHVQNLCICGLTEEAGEVAGLMKRVLRNYPADRARCTKDKFIEELGDVLWYLAACCETQGTSLDEIWEYNKQKLKERYGE